MKPMNRIATAAAALALLVAPATFAGEVAADDGRARTEAAGPCACAPQRPDGATEKKTAAEPSTPEYPVFTDQG